jgi:dihydrofolate synthase/folylpolyglutamate synthase
MDYQEAIEYIETLRTKKASDYSLDRVKNLAKRMGNPERKLSIVHIGGTNGKGSIGTYLATALAESGYVVGRFLTPAVLDYREQIQKITKDELSAEACWIGKEEVADLMTTLAEVAEQMERAGEASPTAFEMETVMAFCCMLRWQVDVAVVEVGMGGSLDATNIIPSPLVTVFSAISLDHTSFLGDTLEQIARAKAGIIKRQVPVVTVAQSSSVEQVLVETAGRCGCQIVVADAAKASQITYSIGETAFTYLGERMALGQTGCYQVENSIAAWETLRQLKKKGFHQIRDVAIQKAFRQTRWQGRFEIISHDPFVLLDGAHNPAGARALKQSLTTYFPEEKFVFLFGVFRDKDYAGILEEMLPLAKEVYTVKAAGERGLPAETLADFLRQNKTVCRQQIVVKNGGTVENALRQMLQEHPKEKIIVFGSLSILSSVREYVFP